VYSRDRAAIGPLIAGISMVHEYPDREDTDAERLSELDAGGRELVVGYAEALAIRSTTRLAVELIRTDNRCSIDDAYLSLGIRARAAGTGLAGAATALLGHGI